jgi:hypothetical protein
MERPRSGTERTPCCRRAHRPNEQTTLQAGSDTKPRRTVLAAYFRIADFTSEPKAYPRGTGGSNPSPSSRESLQTRSSRRASQLDGAAS